MRYCRFIALYRRIWLVAGVLVGCTRAVSAEELDSVLAETAGEDEMR